MKTSITLQLRRFPVTVRDNRTGKIYEDTIIIDKPRLQAAQMVGESSVDRLYGRQGFKVLDIGAPEKVETTWDIDRLWPDDEQAPVDPESGRAVNADS